MAGYLKVEKEQIGVEIMIPGQILVGSFTKDKGIRFTSYFNRTETQHGFIVVSDVTILDANTRKELGKQRYLAINVDYIVTATESE